MTDHLGNIVPKITATTDDGLLAEIDSRWRDHKITMTMIRDILMYMDRTYVPQNKKTPVYDLGLSIFLKVIARHDQLKDRLRDLLLENIALERSGQPIDTIEMKHMLDMLVDLGVRSVGVYATDFEAAFLDQTKRFYQRESQECIANNTCPGSIGTLIFFNLNVDLHVVSVFVLRVHEKSRNSTSRRACQKLNVPSLFHGAKT